MKWINKDPIAEQGGLNLYQMVAGDPVNSFDVLGRKKECCKDVEYEDTEKCCINNQVVSCCPSGQWSGRMNFYYIGLIISIGVSEGTIMCSDTNSNIPVGERYAYVGARLLSLGISAGFITGQFDVLFSGVQQKKDLKGKSFDSFNLIIKVYGQSIGTANFMQNQDPGYMFSPPKPNLPSAGFTNNSNLGIPKFGEDENGKPRPKPGLGGSINFVSGKVTMVQ
jgi:hypothetical protein